MSATWKRALDRRLAEIARQQGLPLRSLAVADAVAAAGPGGRGQVAAHLGIGTSAVDQHLAKARAAGHPGRGALPPDTLWQLLALELSTVGTLPAAWWAALEEIVCSTVIDRVWIEQPGELLAQEVQDAGLKPATALKLADRCRSWNRAQALAVIHECQRRAAERG